MVSGYVLILAVLLLGGVIATLGDRIGMRVGKARLSLFNLRPKQTATVVSIATGSIISASTLALLFGVSSQLRTGVFELGNIQAELANAKAELDQARADQEAVVEDLESSITERERAMKRLREINRFLDRAVEQQRSTENQLRQTREQLAEVSQQAEALQQATESLKAEREELLQQQAAINAQIAERDAEIAQLDQIIAQRDQDIAQREQDIAQQEQLLARLEEQKGFLEQQVAELQRQYQGLFLGNIALGRNQELVSGVVQVENRTQAYRFVAQLLFEANRQAIQQIAPGTPLEQQVILIGNREVDRLIERLTTGQEYVIRVLSAANYITGEPCVVQEQEPCIQVFIDATANELIYQEGERLATIALDAPLTSDRELVERVTLLVASAQFRARQDGIVSDTFQIADNRTETILEFFETLRDYGRPVDIQAIAATDIYTVGPLNLELLAVDNGVVIASTERQIPPFNKPLGPDGSTELWNE